MNPSDLLKWRKKNGYTQIRLGKELEVTTITVYRWEKRMRQIPSFLHLALKYLELKGAESKVEDRKKSKGKKTVARMISFWLTVALLFSFVIPYAVNAEVWDWSCENAIRRLKNSQEEVASAKSEMDSSKSYYLLCTPSRYSDCEIERMSLNNAIDRYNTAISDFNYTLMSFKSSCLY